LGGVAGSASGVHSSSCLTRRKTLLKGGKNQRGGEITTETGWEEMLACCCFERRPALNGKEKEGDQLVIHS